jgi:hypothetical protein
LERAAQPDSSERRPRKLGSGCRSARTASYRCSAEISYRYPQKSPQWLGHFPPLIAQVLKFERVQEISHAQPFGSLQKPPTCY